MALEPTLWLVLETETMADEDTTERVRAICDSYAAALDVAAVKGSLSIYPLILNRVMDDWPCLGWSSH